MNELLNKILTLLRDIFTKPIVLHSLLALSLIGIAYGVNVYSYNYGADQAEFKITKFLKYAAIFPDSLKQNASDYRSILRVRNVGKDITYAELSLPLTANCKIKRIYEQLTDTVLKAHNHLIVASEFMVQSFACTATAAVFFIFAGLSLTFITKAGIEQANPFFVTLFICSIAIGSFFTGLTNIFKHDENARDNLALYLKYINAEQYIRSELTTNKSLIHMINVPCDSTMKALDKTIATLDTKLESINEISLGFNTDVAKALSNLGVDESLK
ncbi:MAG: hypothetical protein ACK5RG_22130 [Cyclobacteriaceae bacterium]|jgi:hypothetical protein|nr:hypothetical protein [Flammeovirgaceae bacterium]